MERLSEVKQVSGHTVRIDRTQCVGTTNCAQVAPEVFVLGADQIITFVDDPQDIERDRLVEACLVCPVDALTAIGPDGRQVAPPPG